MPSAKVVLLDFSRPLGKKEVATFTARRERLRGAFGRSAAAATDALITRLGAPGHMSRTSFRVRRDFSALRVLIPEDQVSDRHAPPRSLRPPATRIVTSQGCALRLYLTALAVAQIHTKLGARALLDLPLTGDSRALGWDDVTATGAEVWGKGAHVSMVRDKKARSLRAALNTLEGAGLVQLTGTPGKRGHHEGFVLLNEAGWQNPGDPVPYTVPTRDDLVAVLPESFVTKGWLNVLEDSELAVLLMVACGKYRLTKLNDQFDLESGEVAMPGDARLRGYGLHRDLYRSACKTLSWFGVLHVREIDRHDDGRAEDASNNLHRLKLRYEGFEENALEQVRSVIDDQLERKGVRP